MHYIKLTKRVVLKSKISKSKPAPGTLIHSICTPLKTAYQEWQSALDDIEWIMVVLKSKISKSKPAPGTLIHSICTPLKTAYQEWQSALDDIEWIMVSTKTILLDIIQPV